MTVNSCLGHGKVKQVLQVHRMARRKKGLFDDGLLRLGLIVLGRWLRRGWRDVPGSRGRLHESETVNESFSLLSVFGRQRCSLQAGTAVESVDRSSCKGEQHSICLRKYCTIDCAIERANCRLSLVSGFWRDPSLMGRRVSFRPMGDRRWLMADGPCVLFVGSCLCLCLCIAVCGSRWITHSFPPQEAVTRLTDCESLWQFPKCPVRHPLFDLLA